MALKAIESSTAVIGNVQLVYIKEDVDKVIDELKRDHHLERHEYIEMVAQRKNENRKLKRALWLMTAEWAEAMGLASCNIANKFMSRENFEVSDDYRNNTVKKYRHRQVVFYKYADYCRHKAEEYK